MNNYVNVLKISNNSLFFLSNNTIWEKINDVAIPRIINHSNISNFTISDNHIVFTSDIEGNQEVFVSTHGASSKRLTYFGVHTQILGIYENNVFVTSTHESKDGRNGIVYKIDLHTGIYEKTHLGNEIKKIAHSKSGEIILQKFGIEYGRWNNYQGGAVGMLWIKVNNKFKELLRLTHNVVCPVSYNNRVYFLSDISGLGQIHSCNSDGKDLKQHTFSKDYYIFSFDITDDGKIFYISGGQIYCDGVPIKLMYPATNNKTITLNAAEVAKYIATADILDKNKLAITIRGQAYILEESQAQLYGDGFKMLHWLKSGDVLGVKIGKITEIYLNQKLLKFDDPGIIKNIYSNPDGTKALAVNTRNELLLWDITKETSTLIDRSTEDITASWSSDGKWITYPKAKTRETSMIIIRNIDTEESHIVTELDGRYHTPIFDETGKYLVFCKDEHVVGSYPYNIDYASAVYVINLNPENLTPVKRLGKLELNETSVDSNDSVKNNADSDNQSKEIKDTESETKEQKEIIIIFENIKNRIEKITDDPQSDHYLIACTTKGPIWYIRNHDEHTLDVERYDWETNKVEIVVHGVSNIFSCNNHWTSYLINKKLITCKTGDKVDEDSLKKLVKGQNGGVWDLPQVRINLRDEWTMIFNEAYRLQKEHFYSGKECNIDWDLLYTKFNLLIPSICTRRDLNEVINQLHGCLCTSHNYIYTPGDIEKPCRTAEVATLFANWEFKKNAWYINSVIDGTPLSSCNFPNDTQVIDIDGVVLSESVSPYQALIGKVDKIVKITTPIGKYNIRASKFDNAPLYNANIKRNAEFVGPDIGYIHISNMSTNGVDGFWAQYSQVYNSPGLVIDIRGNGGGNASSTIFSYLLRKRLGVDMSKYSGKNSYMSFAPHGPMVLLIDEACGSDGDMFAAAFKILNLGPVIGMRTWGGIIGITVGGGMILNDRGITTQAAFPLKFDSGLEVENYGVDPDIKIINAPGDIEDKQLIKAVEVIREMILNAQNNIV